MKVLHVAETIRGGIATYFNELHPHQRASYGVGNVRYIVPSDHRDDLVGFADSEVTTFNRVSRSVPGLIRMAIETLRQVRIFRPDIVHVHSTFAGLVIRPILYLRPSGAVVIYCPHGWAFSRETSQLSHQTTKLVEYLLAKITKRIVCVSGDEYNEAVKAGIERSRLVLVYNGISVDRPLLRSADSVWVSSKARILFIGRLDRQKGYDLLVEVARALIDLIDVRVIGSPVVGKQQDIVLPPNVTLLGWKDRPQIEASLDASDVVIVPSRWEAFGLVALEAMRASKPIVAFRVGALPELVEDGVTGILASPVSAASLVDAVQRVLKLDLPEAGRRGYERFRHLYDVKRTHQVLDDLYVELNVNSLPKPVNVATC